jgi:hypothetical protein
MTVVRLESVPEIISAATLNLVIRTFARNLLSRKCRRTALLQYLLLSAEFFVVNYCSHASFDVASSVPHAKILVRTSCIDIVSQVRSA